MTDMTNVTATTPTKNRHCVPTREYYVYFAVIFLATLPLTFLTYALSAARQFALPERGPIKAAWSQAQIITPRIFSA